MLQQTAQGSLKACALSDETSFAQERGKRGQVLQCSNFKKRLKIVVLQDLIPFTDYNE